MIQTAKALALFIVRIKSLIGLIILLQFAVAPRSLTAHAQTTTGKLRGVVVDRQYTRVLGSCLIVRNKLFEKKVIVDTNGAFDGELPTGTYQVIAQSPGFQQFRWKDLHIEPNATKTLNILLKVAPEKAGCLAGTKRNEKGKLPVCVNLCET